MGAPHYTAILSQGSENVPEAKYMRPMEAADAYTASAGSASISTMDYSLKAVSLDSSNKLDGMKSLYNSSLGNPRELGGNLSDKLSDKLSYGGIKGISTPVPERAVSLISTDIPKVGYSTNTLSLLCSYK